MVKIAYFCEGCGHEYTDCAAVQRHEPRCLKAKKLVEIIKSSLDEGWSPGELINIDTWKEGDVAELFRLVEYALGDTDANSVL